MIHTQPRVYLIAETKVEAPGVSSWLNDLGGSAVLGHITGSDSECLTELAGRRCYKSFDIGLNPNITKVRKDSEEYHRNILGSRHGSVLEHASCTWAFESVSRVFTHELVRNRVGNAFSQESLRYVRLSDGIPFWVPPEIAASQEACELFEYAVAEMEGWQQELSRIFSIDDMTDFAAKKKLTSAFRRIAPDGLATGIVFSTNMRSLRWIIEQRTSRHAEYEIRVVFNAVAKIAVDGWPMIFQDFEPFDTGDGEVKEWIPMQQDLTVERINHPSHYGGDTPYEAIKVVEAWGLGFCLGNAIKYICRAEHKGSELDDLKKARWYIDRRIQQLEGR